MFLLLLKTKTYKITNMMRFSWAKTLSLSDTPNTSNVAIFDQYVAISWEG